LLVSDLPAPLGGRYRFEARLGEGGMGRVYGAHDVALDRSVAVKVIGDHLVGSVEAAQRFRLEARAAASFTHPNVVTVHDVGVTAGGRAFLLMERLEGLTLREALERDGPLEPERALRIVGDVCRVLEDAHRRGLVHRDLKPENVFLARASGGEVTKILDFGIAKVIAQTTIGGTGTASGVLVGSLPYMSPEQLRGEPVSPMWDLWALGVMVVEMLTGSRPAATGPGAVTSRRSAASVPTDLVRHAGLDVEAFCASALAPDPASRPPTARQFLDCFTTALHCAPRGDR
jgi:serine/threonine-protein kinase